MRPLRAFKAPSRDERSQKQQVCLDYCFIPHLINYSLSDRDRSINLEIYGSQDESLLVWAIQQLAAVKTNTCSVHQSVLCHCGLETLTIYTHLRGLGRLHIKSELKPVELESQLRNECCYCVTSNYSVCVRGAADWSDKPDAICPVKKKKSKSNFQRFGWCSIRRHPSPS